MAVGTGTAGELTAEQVQKILVQPLEAAAQFLAAGPTVFDTNGSPVRVPKAPAAGDPADLVWTGENEQIGEADPDFNEVELMPSTMKSIKVITRYSNELARQSVVSLDTAIRDRLVRDVAAKLDTQFLGAGGDGITSPQGVFGWTGVNTVAVAGPLTLDTVMDGYGLALAAGVDVDKMRLFLSAADYMALRGLKDSTGRYLIQPDASQGKILVPALGAQVHVSKHIAAGSAALMDMSQIAVARDLAPTVKILTERYADFDQQAIRVVTRYDAKPLNAEGVVTFTGIVAAA